MLPSCFISFRLSSMPIPCSEAGGSSAIFSSAEFQAGRYRPAGPAPQRIHDNQLCTFSSSREKRSGAVPPSIDRYLCICRCPASPAIMRIPMPSSRQSGLPMPSTVIPCFIAMHQQMRGNISPTGISTMREEPILVFITTLPLCSAVTSPIMAACRAYLFFLIAARTLAASSGR